MPRKRSEGVRKNQTTSKPRKAGKPTRRQKGASVLETKILFPIVGIGASAGGLDAFQKFFTNMPPDTGMAFVLVQHLDPTHKSILSELIKRYTSMQVLEVEDGMLVEPNSVFVIPPNRCMGILHGKLHLLEPTELPGHRTPIDYFFRTLAEDQKRRSSLTGGKMERYTQVPETTSFFGQDGLNRASMDAQRGKRGGHL